MKARTKVLLTSIASIAMCASIAVGGTYALFTDEAVVNVAVTSGTVDVEAVIDQTSLVTSSRGITQTPVGSFANDASGTTGATFNDKAELVLMNITPGDKAEFNIVITNYSNVDIAYRLVAYVDEANALAKQLVWKSAATGWTYLEAEQGVASKTVTVAASVELPETVTYDDLNAEGTPVSYTTNVAFTVEAIQGNGGVFGEVNVENEDQVASALAGANKDGKEVIVTLPGDVNSALTVGEGVNADLKLDDNTVNNILVNNGTLDVSNGTIDTAERGFENYGTANVENVTMNAGSAANYANTTEGEDAVTTYNNFVLTSGGGAIGAVDGGKVVFNSGKMVVNSTSTSARYMFYLEGEGSELEINGGEFAFAAKLANGEPQNGKRSYVYAPAGTKVTINGGTFAAFNYRSGYTGIRGDGEVEIKGGTFGFNPTTWVADGYTVLKNGSTWTVVKGEVLVTPEAGATAAENGAKIAEAIAAGKTSVALAAGNYTMPEPDLRNKALTITGTKDTVIDLTAVDARDQFVTGATVVFEGVTLNFGTANYMGLANTASLVYKNCTINGLQFLYGENVTFENCVLNSNGAEHCVWTYGAKNVSFTECSFTYGDRGINCYKDQDIDGGKQTVNFTNCTFSTTNTASEGAVEINSSAFSVGIEVNMEGCTAPAYGEMAYVSPWDGTNGAKTTINIK